MRKIKLMTAGPVRSLAAVGTENDSFRTEKETHTMEKNMNRPEMITIMNSREARGSEMEFIRYIDGMIKDIVSERGREENTSFAGSVTSWQGDGIVVGFMNSDYGNDQYLVYVARGRASGIPSGYELDNGFTEVYHHQDGIRGDYIISHMPGDWVRLLEEESKRRW